MLTDGRTDTGVIGMRPCMNVLNMQVHRFCCHVNIVVAMDIEIVKMLQ